MIKCNQKDILSIVDNIYTVLNVAEFDMIKNIKDYKLIAESRTGNYILCYVDNQLKVFKLI